jgi:hypothetical protein
VFAVADLGRTDMMFAGVSKKAVPLMYEWAESSSVDFSLGFGWLLAGAFGSIVWYSMVVAIVTLVNYLRT